MAQKMHIDMLTGAMILPDPKYPRVKLMAAYAIKNMDGSAGMDLVLPPYVMNDKEMLRAVIGDVRKILNGIENKHLKEVK